MALELPAKTLTTLSPWRCHHCVCLQLADILLLNQRTNRNQVWLAVTRGRCQKQQIFGMKSNPLLFHTHALVLALSSCFYPIRLCLTLRVSPSLCLSLSLSFPSLLPSTPLESCWSHSVRVLLWAGLIMSQTSERDCYLWAGEAEQVKSWKTNLEKQNRK